MKTIQTLRPVLAACATATLGLLCAPVQAGIATDDNPELLLVMWDPVAKVSYTRDLGLRAADFWITGQQDAGLQFSYALNPANDDALSGFLSWSRFSGNQRWAVVAVDAGPGLAAGSRNLYTTLTQGAAEGVVNPNYTDMVGMTKAQLQVGTQALAEGWIANLNNPKSTFSERNSHRFGGSSDASINGVSFEIEDWETYFTRKGSGFSAKGNLNLGGEVLAGVFTPTNRVGQSSWFYKLTTTDDSNKVVVDEFDNLAGNGFWGLGVSAAGEYSLSYNLAAKAPGALLSTEEGLKRLSTTEYAAGMASRQIAFSEDEFVGLVPLSVSAVPELGSWASMMLGLLSLIGLGQRRQSKAAAQLS